jgi:hypothetical protein
LDALLAPILASFVRQFGVSVTWTPPAPNWCQKLVAPASLPAFLHAEPFSSEAAVSNRLRVAQKRLDFALRRHRRLRPMPGN